MAKVLLTSAEYIKAQTEITDNADDAKILPAIRKCQDIELQSVIGSGLLNKLQTLIDDSEMGFAENAHYKELLDDYIQPYLAYLVVSNLTLTLGQKIGNIGVVENTDEHSISLSLNDRGQLRNYYKNIADSYCDLLQRYLCKNRSHFPELNACGDINVKPNLSTSAESSIWLGGDRGRVRTIRCSRKR